MDRENDAKLRTLFDRGRGNEHLALDSRIDSASPNRRRASPGISVSHSQRLQSDHAQSLSTLAGYSDVSLDRMFYRALTG